MVYLEQHAPLPPHPAVSMLNVFCLESPPHPISAAAVSPANRISTYSNPLLHPKIVWDIYPVSL